MKRPTWATVVGVVGIIAASSSIVGNAQMVITSTVVAQQRQAYGVMDRAVGSFLKPGPRHEQESELLEDYLRGWSTAMARVAPPPWFEAWCIGGGLLGLCAAGTLLVAASALLQVKRWAVPFFYAAAGLDVAVSGAKLAVAASASSLLTTTTLASALVAIVVDGALLAIVAMGDKAAFRLPTASVVSE